MRFKDHAFCIRHLDWSETSQVVALLTREHGQVRGLAKGSKRMSPSSIARFSGGIELLTRGEVVGIVKPSAELATITEWDLQESYPHLRSDLTAHRLALYAADLAHAMVAEQDAHPRVFDALAQLFDGVREAASGGAALLRYQWVVLEDCGYRPELELDAETGEPLGAAASYLFDARAGGLRVAKGLDVPAANGSGPWRVRRETVEMLRSVARGEEVQSAKPQAAQATERANRLLCVYIRAILDRALPTMSFVLGESL